MRLVAWFGVAGWIAFAYAIGYFCMSARAKRASVVMLQADKLVPALQNVKDLRAALSRLLDEQARTDERVTQLESA